MSLLCEARLCRANVIKCRLTMFTQCHKFSFALLALLASVGVIPVETRAEPPAPPPWKQLLWWMPEDTETVIVTQGPFELPKRATEQFKFQEAVQFLAAGPVLDLQDGMLRKDLLAQRVLCAVEGSRRFTSPRSLGMMPYQGCHILQFEPAADDALQNAFRTCQAKAENKLELASVSVAVFTEKLENDVWSFFVCHPRSGILICATDQSYLEETLKRISRKPERRALPVELPEWKHVQVKSRVWAVRHYRTEAAENDPSSPLGPSAAANVSDPAAVGFVFWYNPKGDKVARARYLSGAKDALKLAAEGWNQPSEGLRPKITRAGLGAVEIASPVSEDRTGKSFLFILLGYLGHGIYL
jgi:hypothetical protein